MGFEFTLPRREYLTEQKDSQHPVHVPMVYEHVKVDPARWQYHVLTVDIREKSLSDEARTDRWIKASGYGVDAPEEVLPDEAQLNELGANGWVLVGVLSLSGSTRVQYYFVRQHSE